MNKTLIGSLLVILMAASLFSCKKDISKIGVDVVGSNPLDVVIMDTVTIRAHSEIIDSLRTEGLSSHITGVLMDPVFGLLNASVYAQFSLKQVEDNNPFGNNPLLDSIVLYVDYAAKEVYGDTNYRQHFKIYELGEDMHDTSSYYSFSNLRLKEELLGEIDYIPNFTEGDFIDYNEDGLVDTVEKILPLKVRLTDDLGNRLLSDTTLYQGNEFFFTEFKGIYITTNEEDLPSTGGSVVNLSFISEYTYIKMYYHNDTDDSLSMKFVVNFGTPHFSNFNHYDYVHADADFIDQVVNYDAEDPDVAQNYGQDKIYLQSLAGVRTFIKFPHLTHIPDYYNYAINEAKLFVRNVDEIDPNFPLQPITKISLSQRDTLAGNEEYFVVRDAGAGGEGYFSGYYDINSQQYYFRITQYVQDLIEGKYYDNELRMEIIGGQTNANRTIAGGWNNLNAEKNIKLQLTYTKIDEDDEK